MLDYSHYHYYGHAEQLVLHDLTGYEKTAAHTFESTLDMHLNAGDPTGGFGASVSATLKMTDTTTETWRVQGETTITTDIPDNTTYALWHLYDVYVGRRSQIIIEKDKNNTHEIGRRTIPEQYSELQFASSLMRIMALDHIKILLERIGTLFGLDRGKNSCKFYFSDICSDIDWPLPAIVAP